MNFSIDTNSGFIDTKIKEEGVNKSTFDFACLANIGQRIEATEFWKKFVKVIKKKNNGVILYPNGAYIDSTVDIKVESITSRWNTRWLNIKIEISYNFEEEESTYEKTYDLSIPANLLNEFNEIEFNNFIADKVKNSAKELMDSINRNCKNYNEVYGSTFGNYSLKKEG